jgi:hypothetical protein
MVGIAEKPPRQLAPSVGKCRLDFVIREGSIVINCVPILSKEKNVEFIINDRSRLAGWSVTS